MKFDPNWTGFSGFRSHSKEFEPSLNEHPNLKPPSENSLQITGVRVTAISKQDQSPREVVMYQNHQYPEMKEKTEINVDMK